MFKADRRIYLDKDGKAVEADNPARATLLIAEGQTMPIVKAREYGLVADEAPAPDQGDSPQTDERPARATKRSAGPSEDK